MHYYTGEMAAGLVPSCSAHSPSFFIFPVSMWKNLRKGWYHNHLSGITCSCEQLQLYISEDNKIPLQGKHSLGAP